MTHKNRSLVKLKFKKQIADLFTTDKKDLHATYAYMQQFFFMHRVVEPYGNDLRKKGKNKTCRKQF